MPKLPKFFLSYAHKDEAFKNDLVTHLAGLIKQEQLTCWDDIQITPGDDWQAEINNAMASCDVALLLVSASFLASDFITNFELPTLLQRQEEESLRLVPIIIRPCDWSSLNLGTMQALPKDGKAVITHPLENGERDEVWTAIAKQIRQWSEAIDSEMRTSSVMIQPRPLLGTCNSQSLKNLSDQLRESNKMRIRAHVGDKYLKDLYVNRSVENELHKFVDDKGRLVRRCGILLKALLAYSPTRLSSAETRAVSAALESCENGSALKDPHQLESLGAELMPKGYSDVEASFIAYREYVESEELLSRAKMEDFHEELQDLLEQSEASRKATGALKNVDKALNLTLKAHGKESSENFRITRSFPSKASGTAYLGSTASKVNDAFNGLSRAIKHWGNSRFLGKRPIKVGHSTGIKMTSVSIMQSCRAATDAVKRRCLIVVGVAGSGKTNLLSHWASRDTHDSPSIVLYVKALEETSDVLEQSLDEIARRDLGFKSFENLLNMCSHELETQQKHLTILVDGINEYVIDEIITQSIKSLVARFYNHRIRVVATCRDIYWKNFKPAFTDDVFKVITGRLDRYHEEEFSEAKKRYFKAYRLTTRLEGDARVAFRSPILLRFFCEAYGSRNPNQTIFVKVPRRVTWISLKELFDAYLVAKTHRIAEISNRKTHEKAHEQTISFLVLCIAGKMWEKRKTMLTGSDASLIFDTPNSVSPVTIQQLLLDEDVILGEENGQIYFVYEAFMEYAIAKYLLGSLADPNRNSLTDLFENMIRTAGEFENMRGTMLMLLVMCVEDHGVSFMSQLLDNGEEWNEIVLGAISQIRKRDKDVLSSLRNLAQDARNVRERKEALHILFFSARKKGREIGFDLLFNSKTRVRREAESVLAANSDSSVIVDLIERLESNVDGVEKILSRMVPGHRAVARLVKVLEGGQSNDKTKAVVLKILTESTPGDFTRVLEVSKKFLKNENEDIRMAAKNCIGKIEQRKLESEQKRQRNIKATSKENLRRIRLQKMGLELDSEED